MFATAGASAEAPAQPGYYVATAGASAETLARPGYYVATAGASAETLAQPGYYVATAGASAEAPAQPGYHVATAGASAETLRDPGTMSQQPARARRRSIRPGTYCPAGASAPIADPGGTYSARGASAPTTDPAGTYSSPYALNRLFLVGLNNTPDNAVLSFNSATAVANYYGATSREASLANEFFAGYAGTSATMLFTRYGSYSQAAFARGQH